MAHFVILGTQRTGTTLLKTTLNDHPDIHCSGEMFIEYNLKTAVRRLQRKKKLGKLSPLTYWSWTRENPYRRFLELTGLGRAQLTRDYLQQLYSRGLGESTGFKLMFNQSQRYPEAIRWCLARELKLVHVVRANYLKTLVSRKMTALKPQAHLRGEGKNRNRAVKLTLNCGKLEHDLSGIESSTQGWQDMVGDSGLYMKLPYEGFVAEREQWLGRLFDHLEVPHREVSSRLKKVNPEKLADSIENYEQVRETLEGTKYASLLD